MAVAGARPFDALSYRGTGAERGWYDNSIYCYLHTSALTTPSCSLTLHRREGSQFNIEFEILADIARRSKTNLTPETVGELLQQARDAAEKQQAILGAQALTERKALARPVPGVRREARALQLATVSFGSSGRSAAIEEGISPAAAPVAPGTSVKIEWHQFMFSMCCLLSELLLSDEMSAAGAAAAMRQPLALPEIITDS